MKSLKNKSLEEVLAMLLRYETRRAARSDGFSKDLVPKIAKFYEVVQVMPGALQKVMIVPFDKDNGTPQARTGMGLMRYINGKRRLYNITTFTGLPEMFHHLVALDSFDGLAYACLENNTDVYALCTVGNGKTLLGKPWALGPI